MGKVNYKKRAEVLEKEILGRTEVTVELLEKINELNREKNDAAWKLSKVEHQLSTIKAILAGDVKTAISMVLEPAVVELQMNVTFGGEWAGTSEGKNYIATWTKPNSQPPKA